MDKRLSLLLMKQRNSNVIVKIDYYTLTVRVWLFLKLGNDRINSIFIGGNFGVC